MPSMAATVNGAPCTANVCGRLVGVDEPQAHRVAGGDDPFLEDIARAEHHRARERVDRQGQVDVLCLTRSSGLTTSVP